VKIPGARRTKLHGFQDKKGLQNLIVSIEGIVSRPLFFEEIGLTI